MFPFLFFNHPEKREISKQGSGGPLIQDSTNEQKHKPHIRNTITKDEQETEQKVMTNVREQN